MGVKYSSRVQPRATTKTISKGSATPTSILCSLIEEEIRALLQKGAITEVREPGKGFHSNLFLRRMGGRDQ